SRHTSWPRDWSSDVCSSDLALRIGLIPPVSPAKVRYVGNAASLGAQLCLVSEAERAHAAEVARAIEHVSLAAHPDFEQIFVDARSEERRVGKECSCRGSPAQ